MVLMWPLLFGSASNAGFLSSPQNKLFPAGLGDRVERPRKEKEAMVFGSTMLEIAIGVIFVYLLMSLLCSALAEFIESLFKFRARDLEKGISKLLSNPELTESFFNQPMVKTMFQGRKPSYIPARTFSLALWNMATAAAEGTPTSIAGVTKDIRLLRSAITTMPPDVLPDDLKGALITLIDEAGGDFDKARPNKEARANDAMGRVPAWDNRATPWILERAGFPPPVPLY